jgi:hypothetical protein
MASRPQPSLLRIVRRDPLALLALVALGIALALGPVRPLPERLITIACCGALFLWRLLSWRAFFGRALEVNGVITAIRLEPRVRFGAGVTGRVHALVSFTYDHDGQPLSGSFHDRPARWPASAVGGRIGILVDPLHPGMVEVRPLWLPD